MPAAVGEAVLDDDDTRLTEDVRGHVRDLGTHPDRNTTEENMAAAKRWELQLQRVDDDGASKLPS